eukprot:SAG22_NODE_9026_length_614_cov_0.867961_1_plen_77_part_00
MIIATLVRSQADPLWYNRLLFELSIDPSAADSEEARVSFHEVLLALSLVHETYEGLPYSQLQVRHGGAQCTMHNAQ